MIKTLEVKNFKSIKHLKLDCKRVNVFIGKPNTGKSNLLESVGVFSLPFVNENLKELVRFENLTSLFNDHDVNGKIEIIADDSAFEIKFAGGNYKVSQEDKTKNFKYKIDFDYAGKGSMREGQGNFRALPFKFYQFAVKYNFPDWQADFLQPPRGDNLMQILFTNKNLRKSVADLFGEFGLRIVLKPQEYKIEIQKEVDEVIVAFPYSLVSDTLQRVVFHSAAIETNKDSILIFEEPEAHAFPYYTKFLAERIALDNSNQYFIATHNPYFFLSVLEKTPKDDLGIFITYLQNYQTEVRTVTAAEMPEILDLDASVFFNLDHFLGEQ
jgi:hypothetical protein